MIKEKAYAKINLFLNVINKRFDGYHDLEMVMASIDLFDIVLFKPLSNSDIVIESNVTITTKIEDNLVYKIACYMQKEYNITSGVFIEIDKNIPIAAGLGGGSADAAATLRGLNKLWKLNLSLEQLAEIGLLFGSDVPFCIYNKLCIAKGRGEDLVFLDKKLNLPILLINPNIKISTKDVFSRVKQEHIVEHKINDMTGGIYNCNLSLIARGLHNSLEQIVFEMEPRISEIKNQMVALDIDGVLMSGSGATLFGISKDKKKLKYAYELFNDQYYKLLTKIR